MAISDTVLTTQTIPISSGHMTKPSLGVKPTQVRLTEEQRQRIEALVGTYGMAKFIREAVERELERREADKS